MKAVLKRELKAYFTSVIGWIFLAAFFFVFNLYFVANNLIYGTPYLSYSLSNVAFVLVIIIPILAMRSMAEDRRTKTDQLLYTAPVSIPKVIIGKFLALVASSVVARLSKEDEEYKALQEKIEGIYEEYPKVLAVFDSETESELTEKECAALIEVMELKNQLTDMEMQAVYFRGCYDSVGYLKKAGIL